MHDPTACARFAQLKQEYESALREEALYEYESAAILRHQSEAKAASSIARHRLITHYTGCGVCETDRAQPTPSPSHPQVSLGTSHPNPAHAPSTERPLWPASRGR